MEKCIYLIRLVAWKLNKKGAESRDVLVDN